MTIQERTPYQGRGYIIKKYKVPKKGYDYVWSLTKFAEDQNKRRKYHKFISHILANMLINSKKLIESPEKDYFVPIYSRLIDKEFGREFDWNILKKNKLLEIMPHSTNTHESREFRIPKDIFVSFLKKMNLPKSDTSLECLAFVNIMTGKKVETKSILYQLSNGKKNFNIPSIIKKSILSMQPCPIDLQNAMKWVKKMEQKYDHENDLFEKRAKKCKSGRCYEKHQKEYRTHKGRYSNDQSSLNTILSNTPTKTSKFKKNGHPIYLVKASYRVQKSGRLSEIGGGFQSASRAMKHVSLLNIPELYNYDIKSSQGFILLKEMEKYGIKCGWLRNYLDQKNAKNIYADKIGLPVDLWKECFYALIMGAEAKNKKGAIYKTITMYFNNDETRVNKTHKQFLSVTADLRKATEKWRDTLFSKPKKQHISMYKGCRRWKNACGMIFRDYYILDKKDPEHSLFDVEEGKKSNKNRQKCKRELAAFILQGQEAFFIHWLTVICSKNNIPVYRNEHDGIITGKKIPPQIMEETRIKTGFREANIVIKPICSESEFEEKKKLH